MKFSRALTTACSVAAIALTPLAASADITSVTMLTAPAHDFFTCPSDMTFKARVTGTPGQHYIWIAVWSLNGVDGNTGSAPVAGTLPLVHLLGTSTASSTISYTLPFNAGHPNSGQLQFNTQSSPNPVNVNSDPVAFSFDCIGKLHLPSPIFIPQAIHYPDPAPIEDLPQVQK